MNTTLKSLMASSALLLALGQASASMVVPTTTVNYGAYTLTYDSSTTFGNPAYSFNASGNVTGFAWTVADSVNVASVGGGAVSNGFALPSFTISANPGWSLSGPVTGFLGNLVYTEVGGGVASASVSGTVTVNGNSLPVGGALTKTVTSSNGSVNQGYLSGTDSTPAFAFNTFSFSGGTLTLNASGGVFASIAAQPQNELKISFIAAAVPEPETYAMFLAGLGLMAVIARRRNKHAA